MMREITFHTWCDVCAESGERVEGETVTVTIDRLGPKTLDLCEAHDKELLGPLRNVLGEYGAAPDTPERDAPKPTTSRPEPRPCLWCSRTFLSPTGWLSHARNHHGVPEDASLATLCGNRCPLCGRPADNSKALGIHVHRWHDVSIHQALVDAGRDGDPHGVHADALAHGS